VRDEPVGLARIGGMKPVRVGAAVSSDEHRYRQRKLAI
jgi:hypothetical protein